MVIGKKIDAIALAGHHDTSRKRGSTLCCACGLPVDSTTRGLPMYEGAIVSKDWQGEWGGFDCCIACYDAWLAADVVGVRIRLRALKDVTEIRRKIIEVLASIQSDVDAHLGDLATRDDA